MGSLRKSRSRLLIIPQLLKGGEGVVRAGAPGNAPSLLLLHKTGPSRPLRRRTVCLRAQTPRYRQTLSPLLSEQSGIGDGSGHDGSGPLPAARIRLAPERDSSPPLPHAAGYSTRARARTQRGLRLTASAARVSISVVRPRPRGSAARCAASLPLHRREEPSSERCHRKV